MRSKRSKKWHINRETRDARKLIEQGEPALAIIAGGFIDIRSYGTQRGKGKSAVLSGEIGHFSSIRLIKPR